MPVSGIVNASASFQPLTIERFCQSPSLAGPSPVGVKLAPNGSCVSYLKGRNEDKDFKDLWCVQVQGIGIGDSSNVDVTDSATSPGPQSSESKSNIRLEHKMLVDGSLLGKSSTSIDSLSEEEKARRERLRLGERKGILDYYWSDNSKQLLIPSNEQLYMYNIERQDLILVDIQIPDTNGNTAVSGITDANLSPKSNYISFIKSQNLYVYSFSSKKTTAITSDGGGAIKNGMAEFVAQEEMHRMTGYWWSPDESCIAYTRVDESLVDLVQRNEIYADGIKVTEQRYPYAGKRNAKIELAVVAIGGAGSPPPSWVPLLEFSDASNKDVYATLDFYLARVQWLPNSKSLSFQYQSRDQKKLDLRMLDVKVCKPFVESDEPYTISLGPVSTLVKERFLDSYVNLNNGDYSLFFFSNKQYSLVNSSTKSSSYNSPSSSKDGSNISVSTREVQESGNPKPTFLWLSERNGFKAIFCGTSEENLTQITARNEPWAIDEIEFVDEDSGYVYFTGRKKSILEKHLYRVKLDMEKIKELQSIPLAKEINLKSKNKNDTGLVIQQITEKKGWHNVVFSTASKTPLFLDYFSSHYQPPQCSLNRARFLSEDIMNQNLSSTMSLVQNRTSSTSAAQGPTTNQSTIYINSPIMSPSQSSIPQQRNFDFLTWIEENQVGPNHALSPYYSGVQTEPIFGSFDGVGGEVLYFKMLVPKGVDARSYKPSKGKKFPLVVHVYGGPHVQMCITGARWADQFFFCQYLLQQGFIVFSVDNRGSSGRGAAFEKTIYKRMGEPEILDQMKGIQDVFLSKGSQFEGLVDPNRISIYGHSYGGYMSLLCQFRCWRNLDTNECGLWYEEDDEVCDQKKVPLFRASVAGAPVSDWKLYDTHYTERYMGVPYPLEQNLPETSRSRRGSLNVLGQALVKSTLSSNTGTSGQYNTNSNQMFQKSSGLTQFLDDQKKIARERSAESATNSSLHGLTDDGGEFQGIIATGNPDDPKPIITSIAQYHKSFLNLDQDNSNTLNYTPSGSESGDTKTRAEITITSAETPDSKCPTLGTKLTTASNTSNNTLFSSKEVTYVNDTNNGHVNAAVNKFNNSNNHNHSNYNRSGYRKSSVHPYVKFYDDTKSRLFMYHGMADDNVLFQNSTQVYKLLIDQGKTFQMLDYPGSKHSMSGEKVKIHLYKMITSFLKQELMSS